MKKNLLESLNEVKDFRNKSGQRHPLQIVLLCMIMGILSGRMGIRAIADFTSRHKKKLISELKIQKNRGTEYSTFQRVITGLDFNELATVFNDWAKPFLDSDPQPWLAIDGKVIKGTLTDAQTPYQNWVSLVSVFGAKSGVVLGASSFESQSFSEIAVVPQRTEKLGLKGAVFTLDALHCQKKTIKSISLIFKNDYVIAVKGNQPRLLQAIKWVCQSEPAINSYHYHEHSHGRKIKRTVKLYQALDETKDQFKDLQRFISIERDVERGKSVV